MSGLAFLVSVLPKQKLSAVLLFLCVWWEDFLNNLPIYITNDIYTYNIYIHRQYKRNKILVTTLKTQSSHMVQCVSSILTGRPIFLVANGLGDLGSIPGHVIPKILKMILDASLLNTQQCKVRIKGKLEQSREKSSALPYTSV